MSARVLVTVEGGIAWVESDDDIDVFQIDWDVEDYTTDDLKAKLDELEGFNGEDWYFGIRERLQQRYTRMVGYEREAKREAERQARASKEMAAKTLGIAEGSDEWQRLVGQEA